MAKARRSGGSGSLFRKTQRGPWIARYWTHAGKRCDHSTHTTDRQAAERILAKLVADVALRRDGVIDARDDRYADEGRKPLTVHLADYLAHCELAGQAADTVKQKHKRLVDAFAGMGAALLPDLTQGKLGKHLGALKLMKRAAATLNLVRANVVAFCSWCVKEQRLEVNLLGAVPIQDETRDRRRVRRALTADELARLLEVGREYGREAWYLAALFAGLRRGDLRSLTWADVDFAAGTLTIREGKAKRVDVLALRPELAAVLKARNSEARALPSARVWPKVVTNKTRTKDFLRARIELLDDQGRVVDLHAMRTTLGTILAREGVAPQVAQRIMRHKDFRTTLKSYTALGIEDQRGALAKLPAIASAVPAALAATGTTDAAQGGPQKCQHQGRETVRNGATQCNGAITKGAARKPTKPARFAARGPFAGMEDRGIEPLTPTMPLWCSPN